MSVRAIDNFVYMMTSSKWRPGTILENLYAPQNFDPAFLSAVVWSLESQFPWKRTNRAFIQSNQQWRPWQCVEEFCIRSRTAAVMDKTLTPSPWTTLMDYPNGLPKWTTLKWTTPKNTVSDEYYFKKLRFYTYTARAGMVWWYGILNLKFCIT